MKACKYFVVNDDPVLLFRRNVGGRLLRKSRLQKKRSKYVQLVKADFKNILSKVID